MTMYSRTQPFLMPPFLGTCKDKTYHWHHVKQTNNETEMKNIITLTTTQKEKQGLHFFRNTCIYDLKFLKKYDTPVYSSRISNSETQARTKKHKALLTLTNPSNTVPPPLLRSVPRGGRFAANKQVYSNDLHQVWKTERGEQVHKQCHNCKPNRLDQQGSVNDILTVENGQ